MPNYILKIFLKHKDERSISENLALLKYWTESNLSGQELKYALTIKNLFII